MEYLEEVYPTPTFMPPVSEPLRRAQARRPIPAPSERRLFQGPPARARLALCKPWTRVNTSEH